MSLTAFDPTGPLPTGTTLLEASAGTGKTYALAALVARYVAEGRALLDDMLLITFSRAASQELRERVRDRLVTAELGLARALAGRGAGLPAHPRQRARGAVDDLHQVVEYPVLGLHPKSL